MAQAQAALAEPLSSDLCIQTGEITVEGRLERTGPEMYSFTVTSPQPLEGLSLSLQQQELRLGYREMELELKPEVLPGSFALSALNQMLDELMRQQEFSFSNTQDGGGILSGKVSGRNFELTLDPQCCPLSFSIPEEGVVIQWPQKNAS